MMNELLGQMINYFSIKTEKSRLISRDELLEKRRQLIGSTCPLFFPENPLVVHRAFMQYLYDENDRKYLDCISNVQHVGHCHPQVVSAISKQMSLSNCNLRFVHSNLADCAEKLLETLPGFDTVLFCNSGSEANDLALRLARDFTSNHDVIVVDHAYHGHVSTTMQMSPYKFPTDHQPARSDWVHVTPCPDVYRGSRRLPDCQLNDPCELAEFGRRYADDVGVNISQIVSKGGSLCAFLCEALQSCGGQILPPPGYFTKVAEHVHKAGGLMIIDEVQTGFGRVGQQFWAHQLTLGNENESCFVPDVVTMGKPMGNGFPVAAVATRKEIADVLGHGVAYFNTYGGNPVACSAVLSVLSILKRDDLLAHSQSMGQLFDRLLRKLRSQHDCIGDIRGVGLFWGVDLVKCRETREPNSELAAILVSVLRQDYCILVSADGPYSNVVKIKPPLCFNKENVLRMFPAALKRRSLGTLVGGAHKYLDIFGNRI